MRYFMLEPEVAGGLGEHAELDTSIYPPRVTHLHFQFEGWLGDDLLETFPIFLVSESLATKLAESRLGAFTFRDAEVTLSPEAEEMLAGRSLPAFRWWDVSGRAGVDDFGVTDKAELVVSDRALAVLREGRIDQCDVTEYQG